MQIERIWKTQKVCWIINWQNSQRWSVQWTLTCYVPDIWELCLAKSRTCVAKLDNADCWKSPPKYSIKYKCRLTRQKTWTPTMTKYRGIWYELIRVCFYDMKGVIYEVYIYIHVYYYMYLYIYIHIWIYIWYIIWSDYHFLSLYIEDHWDISQHLQSAEGTYPVAVAV